MIVTQAHPEVSPRPGGQECDRISSHHNISSLLHAVLTMWSGFIRVLSTVWSGESSTTQLRSRRHSFVEELGVLLGGLTERLLGLEAGFSVVTLSFIMKMVLILQLIHVGMTVSPPVAADLTMIMRINQPPWNAYASDNRRASS